MLIYALKRLLGAIPTLFIIVTLTFFMMRIAPGGPFDSQRRLPPEVEANIKAAYNLDKPLVEKLPASPLRDFVATQKGPMETAFAIDDTWWAEHGAALESRFRAWADAP